MNQLMDQKNTQTENNQEREREELLLEMANILGGPENLDMWLKRPHPLLDGRTPQSYVDEGELRVLHTLLMF